MSAEKPKSKSTSLSQAAEQRLRMISTRENRTVANVMENAVRVFTLMPKELRDRLVELSSEEELAASRFEEISRLILFETAQQNYEQASLAAAMSGTVDQQMLAEDELVVVSSPVV